MSEVCTKADLRDVRDQILDEVRSGNDRTHERLDVLNGRVGRGEVQAGKHDERLKNVEYEVFDRRKQERRGTGESEKQPIRRRDVTLVVAGGAALVAIVKFIAWIGPALQALAP